MTLALDLAARDIPVVLLDDDCQLSTGSRAICFAKRTLDVWDRLGVGEHMTRKGVSWNVGRVFFKDNEVWSFDLLPEPGHRRPAFINLQQYYCEGFLHDQVKQQAGIDLRWKHKVVDVQNGPDTTTLKVETPGGSYTLATDWLVACDGSRSPVRKMLGQESHGRIFRDRFLIADVRMQANFPTERWFWFDPPFHPNQSVLLHRQPDNVWRIDFQLGWDADPIEETKPENVIPRIQALLGKETAFELEWVSIYTFACERMDTFGHGRVLFAGDSAHRVSPFGARGANSGVQDADNLGWKLARVIQGISPRSLLDTYLQERERAADENILNSSRSTDFITPKSTISRLFRDTVLTLAKDHEFARRLVNSGRLSMPTFYTDSALNTPDADEFSPALPLGAVAPDGPIEHNGHPDWWLGQLKGNFTLAVFCFATPPTQEQMAALAPDANGGLTAIAILGRDCPEPRGSIVWVRDTEGLLAQRYDAREGTCYLIRPDQHIAARWRRVNREAINQALARATGF
jgi:3-(3-hydroxy-phenyl)propionate hydroxylase